MLTRRNVLGWFTGLFASIPLFGCGSNKDAIIPSIGVDGVDGVMGIVVSETCQRIESKLCQAETLNEFMQLGFQMMPEATKISVCFSENKYTLLEGQGFHWNIN